MKLRTTFNLLCLVWMVLLSIGLLDVHADPCATERKAYKDAKSTEAAAEKRYYKALKAAYEYVGASVPTWLEEAADPNTVLETTLEGVQPGLPSGISGLLKGISADSIVQEHNDALTAWTQADCKGVQADER